MISHWFRDEFEVTRKAESDVFASEPYDPVGVQRGFIQPTRGGVLYVNGVPASQASHVLYCPPENIIELGDRIADVYGRLFNVVYVQPEGISGISRHAEIGLEAVS